MEERLGNVHNQRVLLLVPPTAAGFGLAERLRAFFEGRDFEVEVQHQLEQKELLNAVFTYRWVLFDASYPEEGSLLPSLTILPWYTNFVVVSRTYLPTNLMPVTHDWHEPHPYPFYPRAGVSGSYANEDIMAWFHSRFDDVM